MPDESKNLYLCEVTGHAGASVSFTTTARASDPLAAARDAMDEVHFREEGVANGDRWSLSVHEEAGGGVPPGSPAARYEAALVRGQMLVGPAGTDLPACREPDQLDPAEARTVLTSLLEVLYPPEYDRQWSPDTLDDLHAVFARHKLVPG